MVTPLSCASASRPASVPLNFARLRAATHSSCSQQPRPAASPCDTARLMRPSSAAAYSRGPPKWSSLLLQAARARMHAARHRTGSDSLLSRTMLYAASQTACTLVEMRKFQALNH